MLLIFGNFDKSTIIVDYNKHSFYKIYWRFMETELQCAFSGIEEGNNFDSVGKSEKRIYKYINSLINIL